MDNPCTTLSNVGSYTSWIVDFNNLRCSRTINNSYTANTEVKFWSQEFNTWSNYDSSIGNFCYTNSGISRTIGDIYTTNLTMTVCNGNTGVCYNKINYLCKILSYKCLNGGTLSGSNCTKIDTEYKPFSSF